MVQAVWREVEQRHLTSGKPLDPSVLFMVDEAAHVAALRHLDLMASTGAGLGATLCTVWQDLAQLDNRYGRRQSTVWNNHRAKIVLGGQSDPQTLDTFSRIAGEARLTRESRSPQGSSWTDVERPVAPASLLRQLAAGEAGVLYGHLAPGRIRLVEFDA